MTTVEVFADIWCPFTHVGLHRLAQRRAEAGADFTIRVRAWPLELVNGAPLDADLVAEEVAELRAQVAPELFVGFDRRCFPESTLLALELAASAYRRDESTGERASFAVRDALFEHGRDIGDPDELAAIAASLELPTPHGDSSAVHDDWHDGQRRGVRGSPHFFAAGADAFCPALRIERVEGHRQITFDRDRFESFLQRCTTG